jgi:hypothetical protein
MKLGCASRSKLEAIFRMVHIVVVQRSGVGVWG